MVDAVSSGGSVVGSLTGAAAGGNSAASQIDFNTYLKLLVTQLQNQDPLNPMDGTEFTKELATFSQLEQQIQSNNYLERLTQVEDSSTRGLATSFLGKAALVAGNKLEYMGEGTLEFGYTIEDASSQVKIDIVANDGSGVVRTLYGDGTAAKHMMEWDGKNEEGELMAAGDYTLRIKATDIDGNTVPSEAYTYGVVTAVLGSGDDVRVEIHDGRTSTVNDVMTVRMVSAG